MVSMHFRKTQNKMLYLQRAIEQSETKEQSVQDYLGNIIRVVGTKVIVKQKFKKKLGYFRITYE